MYYSLVSLFAYIQHFTQTLAHIWFSIYLITVLILNTSKNI